MTPPSVCSPLASTATTSILDGKSVLITGGTGSFGRAFVERGQVMTALAARGIGTQVHYIPLPQHPFHRRKAGDHAAMPRPGADAYYARTLSLPMYPGLDDATAGVIVETLAACLTELRR